MRSHCRPPKAVLQDIWVHELEGGRGSPWGALPIAGGAVVR
jgi:hypothetical protein